MLLKSEQYLIRFRSYNNLYWVNSTHNDYLKIQLFHANFFGISEKVVINTTAIYCSTALLSIQAPVISLFFIDISSILEMVTSRMGLQTTEKNCTFRNLTSWGHICLIFWATSTKSLLHGQRSLPFKALFKSKRYPDTCQWYGL